MNNINWNDIKFRASSWGNLLCEPQSKADREAGRLGATCQKELLKIYSQEKYGRKKDITTSCMDKGKIVEPESIKLFSLVEGVMYFKNEDPLENEWFKGHPDIFRGDNIQNAEEVSDIKSSWELDTFMPKLIEEPDKGYVAQLNVYYDLTGAQGGSIAYCLVDCPLEVLEAEKRKLLYAMNVISEESPEYKRAAAELEHLLTFPDIPKEERVIKKEVLRDEALIKKMKDKVPIFRQWLSKFEQKHTSLYRRN